MPHKIKILDRDITIHSKKSKKVVSLYQNLLHKMTLSPEQLSNMMITPEYLLPD